SDVFDPNHNVALVSSPRNRVHFYPSGTEVIQTMATVVLTVTPKSDTSGTIAQPVSFRMFLGAASQTVPVNAGNPVSATFQNVAPGDYSAIAQNLDAAGNVVGNPTAPLAVHVPAPSAVFVADTLSAVVS